MIRELKTQKFSEQLNSIYMAFRIPVYLAVWLLLPVFLSGQTVGKDSTAKVYKVNRLLSLGIFGAGALGNTVGLQRLRDKPEIPISTLNNLNRDRLWGIDRAALRVDPLKKDKAASISDRYLYSSLLLPVALFLDKDIRRDWLDIALLYGETQMLASNFYTWGPIGPTFIGRFRPAVYFEELPLKERNFGGLRNSFFSGHVSSTATATFFTAQVLLDYNPHLRKYSPAIYALATVTPIIVGINRVRALKHFPTDTIIGGIVGAGFGILTPTLHKRWGKRLALSALYEPSMKGMAMRVKF